MAVQVAVYALLETAIEVEMLLSLDRRNKASPVKEMYVFFFWFKYKINSDFIVHQLTK